MSICKMRKFNKGKENDFREFVMKKFDKKKTEFNQPAHFTNIRRDIRVPVFLFLLNIHFIYITCRILNNYTYIHIHT